MSVFGAAAVGGLTGFLVGRLSPFEIGLGVGLLIFGAVAFCFSARCLLEYRAFAYAGPNALWSEVIAIEDRAVNGSGSITTPVSACWCWLSISVCGHLPCTCCYRDAIAVRRAFRPSPTVASRYAVMFLATAS
jgi:hypothetical protein